MNVTINNPMVKLAINKSILKEFSNDRTVYLNNGDEFQIQLFNPYDYVIGARIHINGTIMSYNYLVLRPGERVWLERHIDSAEKLKFITYETEDSAAGRYATRNNGEVKVEFYREHKTGPSPAITYVNHYHTHWDNNVLGPGVKLGDYQPDILYGSSICADDAVLSSIQQSLSLDSANGCVKSFADVEVTAHAAAADTVKTALTANTQKSIETGRIERGSNSNQRFDNIDTSFEYAAFVTETLHILPMSRKPVTSGDLKKIYCHQCGRKIKAGFRFCPFCGSKQ